MARKNQALMLTYNLDNRGTSSVYEYLYQLIREDIAQGTIPSNAKLPSKRALAAHLGIGVATVAAAYEQLITEGFVRSEQRRGFFVENVPQYRCKAVTETHNETPADEATQTMKPAYDQDFFVDLKANRTSVDLFPTSVWAHYMREALSLPSYQLLRPVPLNGLPELRRAIAAYLRRARGMDVSPESIVIGAGSEYLYGRLLQMMGPNTIFAMENPGYKKFAAISELYGNPWRGVAIDEAGLIIDALEESGADVAHVSAANHFPTGIVMPIKRRLELLEWAGRARKRFIIEDDYDSEFRYVGRPIMPLFADDAAGKVIYMNAFSKTMMPSLRISYLVLPPQLLARYLETMSFYSCTVSSVEQYALARFIDEGHLERHVNRMRNFYRNQRASVLREIARSPLAGISAVEERNAGTHFLLHVRTALSEKEVRQRGSEAGLNISMLSDYQLGAGPGASPRQGREERSCGRTGESEGASTSASVREEQREKLPEGADALAIVVNYAGISPDRVEESIRRLAGIFPECANR